MEPVAEVAVGQRERLAEALGEHRLGYVRPYAGYCLCGEWGSPEDPITYTVAEAYPGHLADVALAHFAAELEATEQRGRVAAARDVEAACPHVTTDPSGVCVECHIAAKVARGGTL